MSLTNGLSQMDRAMNDTLVSKADEEQFDGLCAMYGLPRIPYIQRKYWRKAVLAANFAKRDGLGTIFSLCREGLRGQDAVREAVIKMPASSDPANPDRFRLFAIVGEGFLAEDQFRLWEINGKVYFSGVRAYVSNPGDLASYLNMHRYKGPHWAAFDSYAIYGRPLNNQSVRTTATRLPFHLRGAGGKAELVLEDDSTVPPTFLQDFFSASANVPFSTPPAAPVVVSGGVARSPARIKGVYFQEHKELTATYTGAVQYISYANGPVYVSGLGEDAPIPAPGTFIVSPANGGAAVTYQYTSAVYSSTTGSWALGGVQTMTGDGFVFEEGQIIRIPLAPERGGDYVMSLRVNGALRLVLALANGEYSVSDDTTEISLSAGDFVTFSISSASAPYAPTISLQNAHILAAIERPSSEPLGGALLADATNDQPGVGPFPIYLEAGQAKDWQDTLDRMIALGVEPVARISIHLNSD